MRCTSSSVSDGRRLRRGRSVEANRLVELQRVAGGGDHRPLDHVLELADVAGPRVMLQRVHHRLRHLGDLPPELALVAVDEEPHQPRDVFEAFLQRRQLDRIHAQAVVQVGAERALGDRGLEVAMRRRNHADIDRLRARRPDALELAFLQHAQELHLDVRRQIADLVQEDRAAVGQLEAPLPQSPRRR